MKNIKEMREYLKGILGQANAAGEALSVPRELLCNFQVALEIPGMIPQPPNFDPKKAKEISDIVNGWLTENNDHHKSHVELSRGSVRNLVEQIDSLTELRFPEPESKT